MPSFHQLPSLPEMNLPAWERKKWFIFLW